MRVCQFRHSPGYSTDEGLGTEDRDAFAGLRPNPYRDQQTCLTSSTGTSDRSPSRHNVPRSIARPGVLASVFTSYVHYIPLLVSVVGRMVGVNRMVRAGRHLGGRYPPPIDRTERSRVLSRSLLRC